MEFESDDAQKKCPKLRLLSLLKRMRQIKKKPLIRMRTVSEKNPQQKYDIRWSDFKDVPLCELIEHFRRQE